MNHLERWIEKVLKRESVMATAPEEGVQRSREKLVKRLARIEQARASSSIEGQGTLQT
jgi:hypothetical protein